MPLWSFKSAVRKASKCLICPTWRVSAPPQKLYGTKVVELLHASTRVFLPLCPIWGITRPHPQSCAARQVTTVLVRSPSVLLGDPTVIPVGSFVSSWFLPLWERHLLHRDLLPWHHAEQVGYAIQPSTLFVIGLDYVPGRLRGIGGREHCVARM